MTLSIVTSFNRAIWNNHGKTCIESWLRHLKGDYELHLYIDGPIPSDLPSNTKERGTEGADGLPAPGPRVYTRWLDTEPEYTRFLTETRDVTPNPHIPPEHKFRFEFRRFWPKVRSIYDAALAQPDGSAIKPVLWLDADILFKKDLSVERILDDLDDEKFFEGSASLVCLDRGAPWFYMDSGYLLIDPRTNNGHWFVDAIYNIYTTKTIFRFTEWHDAFLMSQVMNILWGDNKGDFVKSLSGMSSSLHPLDDSWLAEYMTHLKGHLKAHANSTAKEALCISTRRLDIPNEGTQDVKD